MKNVLLAVFLLSIPFLSSAQTYAYSFKGDLNSDDITLIEQECSSLASINTAKAKYKEDQHKGEIIFRLEPTNSVSEGSEFSATSIKQLIQKYKLDPIDFRLISQ